jgi:preprotein translocase SecF subunit
MFQILINKNYPIIGIRRIMMTVSAVVILIGIASIAIQGGLNYGIDFKGGYKFIVQFQDDVDLSNVRQVLNDGGLGGGQVSDFGTHHEVLIILQAEGGELAEEQDIGGDAVQNQLANTIREAFPENPVVEISQEKVGPKIGAELRTQALWAIVYSLLGIVLYITWRFEFKFSIAAIIALVHDVVITLGIFSLLGKEINLTILGALLTIVGYSLNDTIVVFDRIRENLRSRSRAEAYPIVVNQSVNQTLSRTVITSMTTLIVVLFLFFFGGAVIHDFAFALMVGVLVGTYSSLFIASPVLVEWQAAVQARRQRKLATNN